MCTTDAAVSTNPALGGFPPYLLCRRCARDALEPNAVTIAHCRPNSSLVRFRLHNLEQRTPRRGLQADAVPTRRPHPNVGARGTLRAIRDLATRRHRIGSYLEGPGLLRGWFGIWQVRLGRCDVAEDLQLDGSDEISVYDMGGKLRRPFTRRSSRSAK